MCISEQTYFVTRKDGRIHALSYPVQYDNHHTLSLSVLHNADILQEFFIIIVLYCCPCKWAIAAIKSSEFYRESLYIILGKFTEVTTAICMRLYETGIVCIVWDDCGDTDKTRLEDMQLRFARAVTGAKRGTSHQNIYNEICWPLLSERRKNCKLKFMYKVMHHGAPPYLTDLIPNRVRDVTAHFVAPAQFVADDKMCTLNGTFCRTLHTLSPESDKMCSCSPHILSPLREHQTNCAHIYNVTSRLVYNVRRYLTDLEIILHLD